ncbi:TPA: hypothetical protein U1C79_001048 [Streptococcus suis]|nr:hypothetical protein [Streptococcus suis]HEM3668947.1 hypothetical protein [Streptococcus suis]HEM3675663.1 hypothetical protein [Streptococcus suis]HEM3685262.1 hypothetical protein [Streptococcus suis]HEM3692817.1 hypothetical protein [Streptococcus suis]
MQEKKRKGYATQEQQREATKRWLNDDEKRKHRNYLTYRGTARSFIRNHAKAEDLDELETLIKERRKNF